MKTMGRTLVCLLIAVMLTLQIAPVSAQGGTPPLVDVTVTDEPSNEDAGWPITKRVTHKRTDPSTGKKIVETIVIRQQPLDTANTDCNNFREGKFNAALVATCQYSITIEKTSTMYVGGGAVTSIVKAFARKYCNTANGECDYVKMTKVQVYWKRTSTSLA